MSVLKSFLLASGAIVALASGAFAADLPTRKAPVAPPPAANCYASFWTWLDSSAADCPLSYWGVTFYGQVDVGGGYDTHAAGFNKDYPQGVQELISAQNHNGKWQWIPNGLSQSNVGIKWKEQVVPSWYFIGDVNFGFDPYSLRFSNGPASLEDNNTLPAFARTANGDSSRAYGPVNTRAYLGIQNQTFGTLTYGRQYAFSTDNANFYDPFGGAYGFSMIGNSSTIGGGLGDTELARFTNSIKYVYNDHGVRAGVVSNVGGWNAGNNSQFGMQGDVGFDWNGLSVDGVYSYNKDAVALGILGSGTTGLVPAPFANNVLKATIENVSAFQIAAKYKWNQFTLYGGYQNSRITNPTDLPVTTSVGTSQVRNFNDGDPAVYGTAVQFSAVPGVSTANASLLNNAFPVPRQLQVLWIGGKYNVLPNLDLAAGYYRYWQNDYLGSTEVLAGKPTDSCAPNTGVNPLGGTLKGTNSSKCRGVEDAISGLIDWRPWKRVDVYGGVMYSKINGGLASGFFADNNLSGMAGVRVSF